MGSSSAVLAIECDSALDAALRQLAAALAIETHEAALGCFVALAYRHLQQPVIAVRAGIDAAGSAALLIGCAISEGATLHEIIAAAAHSCRQGAAPPDHAALFDVAVLCSARPADGSERGTIQALRLIGDAAAAPRLQELGAQLEQLIRGGAWSRPQDLFDYSLLSTRARALLPDAAAPLETTAYPLVAQLLREQSERHPDNIAISDGQRRWSYRQLMQTADVLAVRLADEGIRSGDVVALCGRRSFALFSAMLAIFLSGAVLLTLDPKLPLQRRRSMVRQAGAKWLLYREPESALSEQTLPALQLDALLPPPGAAAAITASLRPCALEARAPAYIFFTSGSTGTPKAVLGTHAGLAHFLDWERSAFSIGAHDRGAQIISLSFDAVLRDVFVVLAAGGTLCLPPEDDIVNGAALLPWLAEQRITLLHAVPSLLRTWLNQVPDGLALPHLRYLLLSGEPVSDLLVRRFRELFGDATVIVNLYGPTETTMVKCYHRIGELQAGVQPIGRPMPQTQVLILNRRQQLCGLDESGQIAIRTPFRTLGYLDAPDATARVFVPNPFRDDPDDLIYLTGDRGRYRSDGLLEIAGRLDSQVKIRGVRIEPGEIEHLICQHPDIHSAAVTAFEDASSGKYLAAYLVPRAGASQGARVTIERIRSYLQERVADYMVPTRFVLLDELPLSANGKVDLKSLPVPARSAGELAGTDVPTTALERRLAKVWQAALGLESLSVNENFGALGGDSLSSVSAVVAMKRIGVPDAAAKGIFAGASIRQIAAQIEATVASEHRRSHWGELQMPIFVRALSIILVVMGHLGLLDTLGTIKALLVVSGLSFARFQLQAIRRHDGIAPLRSTFVRLALPTLLYTLLLGMTLFRGLRLDTYLFFDNFVDPNINGSSWFIELLLQCLLLTAVPLSLRPIRRFALENPYQYGLIFMGLCWLASRIVPLFWNTDHLYNRVPQILLWMLAYGWCAAFSDTTAKRLLSSAALLLAMRYTYEWFGWYPLLMALAITWLDRIPIKLPPWVLTPVNAIAAASLFIYLTHGQFGALAHKLGGNAYAAVLIAIAGGVLAWQAWDTLARALLRLRRGLPLLAPTETA